MASPEMTAMPRFKPTVRSALWAAWGDAVGFPAELVDEATFVKRVQGAADRLPFPWVRLVGGRMGARVELPAGAYSDDTQLRLAVGRCIRSAGEFDLEAFSKIELPVFLSYQLGAGRGTKAAAQQFGRRATRWYSAFFDRPGARYVDGGGNGAAMRVQPHVWARNSPRPEEYLLPVLRDTICTHGHPRAIIGAALHALCLGSALDQEQLPGPDRWERMGQFLECLIDMPQADPVIADRWLPVWEDKSNRRWDDAMREAVDETTRQLEFAAEASSDSHELRDYADLARTLGGLDAATRGAGTLSAVLALWVAWHGRNAPEDAIRLCAGLLGSDTDTIASMAGALVGTVATTDPPGAIQDRELHAAEATRLAAMSDGEPRESFPHPDPLHWQPPASLADAVGLIDGNVHVAGLGLAELIGEPLSGDGKNPGLWQWARMSHDQMLLIKRREQLPTLHDSARPRSRSTDGTALGQASLLDDSSSLRYGESRAHPRNAAPRRLDEPRFPDETAHTITATAVTPIIERAQNRSDERQPVRDAASKRTHSRSRSEAMPQGIEDAVEIVVESGFERLTLSRLLMHFARQEDGPYRAGLFAYRVGQALSERERG